MKKVLFFKPVPIGNRFGEAFSQLPTRCKDGLVESTGEPLERDSVLSSGLCKPLAAGPWNKHMPDSSVDSGDSTFLVARRRP